MNAWVKDVTDATFAKDVVEGSHEVPIVVDFWAPWCGPCRTLGPLLERLAAEHAGAFVVAKINVDENPGVAGQFGIRSIPAVKAIRGGEIVDEFVGALPEASLREFLRRILPTRADRLAEQGLVHLAAGRDAEAERDFRDALELDPNHPISRLGLGKLLSKTDREAALAELDRVLAGTPERAEADRLAAKLRLGDGDAGALEALRAKVEGDPADLAARLALARELAAEESYELALQHLLEIVRRNRAFDDEVGRRSMLDLFNILGPRHALTEKYRSELARVLYS